MKIKEVENKLMERKDRSTWDKAITQYALEMLLDLDWYECNENDFDIGSLYRNELEAYCLNGAMNWREYSFGGCALCYNYDIKERLYPPSLRDKYVSGEKLLFEQSRACRSAYLRIWATIQSIRDYEIATSK